MVVGTTEQSNMLIILILFFLIISGTCFADGPPSSPILKEKEIRAVDSFIKSQERIRSHKHTSLNRREYRETRRYMFGDVDGDKVPDLVVRYTLEEGNNWTIYIVAFKRPLMQHLAHARVGGKGYRGVELAAVADGVIEIKTGYYSRRDALCCPSVAGTSAYSIAKGVLIEDDMIVDCAGSEVPKSQ